MRRRRRRRRAVPDNFITQTVTQLGGVLRTASEAGVALETVHLAMKNGRFTKAEAVVRLARALCPEDEAAQMRMCAKLAGLPD